MARVGDDIGLFVVVQVILREAAGIVFVNSAQDNKFNFWMLLFDNFSGFKKLKDAFFCQQATNKQEAYGVERGRGRFEFFQVNTNATQNLHIFDFNFVLFKQVNRVIWVEKNDSIQISERYFVQENLYRSNQFFLEAFFFVRWLWGKGIAQAFQHAYNAWQFGELGSKCAKNDRFCKIRKNNIRRNCLDFIFELYSAFYISKRV